MMVCDIKNCGEKAKWNYTVLMQSNDKLSKDILFSKNIDLCEKHKTEIKKNLEELFKK